MLDDFLNREELDNSLDEIYSEKSGKNEVNEEELDRAISRDDVMDLRNKLEKISKEKNKEERYEKIDYKILKTKASSHFGAHVIGPIMEWYYNKFTGYSPVKYRNDSCKE